ncbi:hypothetical protein BC834DRAFT_900697 [Gloeopeniophorella convolvens]|nr:hypothetical protein BC834DRAFT_900697 [Gloeopeniophorella convolvens]
MPAPPLARPTRSGRGSISALPAPSAPLRIAKKAPAVEAPVRRPTAPASSSVPPRAMALGGVQRPPAHAKVAAPQPTARTTSLGAGRLGPAVKATTGLGPRPSSLRAPMARAASSGMPRPSISGTGAGATRLPMPGAGRPSGVGASASARMLRRP